MASAYTRLAFSTVALAVALPFSAPASEYEDALEQWGLASYGKQRDPTPEGKRIVEVLVASEDIVAPTDPYPMLLNAVHHRTDEEIIRLEVLQKAGDRYDRERASETERNLRRLSILAVARVVPIQEPNPDEVGLLVVTKDLWSIRLNTEYNFVGSLLQYLQIRPSENNLLGRYKLFSVDFFLKLDTLSLGETFLDRRLFGTFLTASESASLVFNRRTQQLEGSWGSVDFGLPLVTLSSERGFDLKGLWDVEIIRIFRGASVWDLPIPGTDQTVPYVYNQRRLQAEASYTRSYGLLWKTNVSAGLGAYTRRYSAPASLGPDQASFLKSAYLPFDEDAVYPFLSFASYRASYQVLEGFKAFALSEDYQLGHSVSLTLRWANPIWIHGPWFLEGGGAFRYRWYVADDLLTLEAAAAVRALPWGSDVAGGLVDRRGAFQLLNYSPSVGPGRIVFRGLVDLKAADLNHIQFLLGGGNGLRGLAPEALQGTNLILFNLEYRTRPIEVQTVYAGLVFFADAGSAYETSPSMVYTVGTGLRILIPQFNRETIRIDFGYVVGGGSNPPWLGRFSGNVNQIEDYRPTFLDHPLP